MMYLLDAVLIADVLLPCVCTIFGLSTSVYSWFLRDCVELLFETCSFLNGAMQQKMKCGRLSEVPFSTRVLGEGCAP